MGQAFDVRDPRAAGAAQVPPRANAAVKVVTVLTDVNASEFRKELAFRFRKNAMRYFTKY